MRWAYAFGLVLFFLALFISPVFSDGMMYTQQRPDYWNLSAESSQLAAINYENGYENMILSIGFEPTGRNAVWIFPVPASPDDTVVNMMGSFPNFYGTDVKQKASQSISDSFLLMRATQIYPLPFLLMVTSGIEYAPKSMNAIGQDDSARNLGITVYESFTKGGVTTQLVTAQNGSSLTSYLISKGAVLPESSRGVLDEYVGKNYSFVVAFISDQATYVEQSQGQQQNQDQAYYGYGNYYNYSNNGKMLAVYLRFPAQKIFFPLRPTSVYGSTEIPVKLFVTSFVTPEFYPEIASQANVSYKVMGNYYAPDDDIQAFFNHKTQVNDLKYTEIDFTVPSKYFKADLMMSPTVPEEVSIAEFISNNAIVWGIILFAVISCVSSMIAGMIVFRKDKPKPLKFLAFGLANFVTLIGFGLLAYFLKVGSKCTGLKEVAAKKVSLKKFFVTVLIWTAALAAVLSILFGWSSFYYNPFEVVLIFGVIFGLLFWVVAPFTWAYYNKSKTVLFIGAFSILFLVLSFVFEMVFSYLLGF